MSLELKLVFEVLFLFNLPKIKVLLNDEVYVGSRLPFSDDDVCVRALILVEVRLVLVLCLNFALQEVIFEFVAEIDPIPFNQNLKIISSKTLKIVNLIALKRVLGAARLRRNTVIYLILFVLVFV